MTTAPATDPRRITLTVACDHPRCQAQLGGWCRTPNGRTGFLHKSRIAKAHGQPATAPAKRPRRLSDAQAIRVEWAAEMGRYIAPDQSSPLRGSAAERAVADALQQRGIIHQVATTDAGERIFHLTEAGWAAYHNDRRVIRRIPDDQHPDICPCRTTPNGDPR